VWRIFTLPTPESPRITTLSNIPLMLKSLPPTRLHPALKAWEAGTTHLRLRACNLGFILFSGSLPRRSRSNLQAVYHLYQVTTKLRLGKGAGVRQFFRFFPTYQYGRDSCFRAFGGAFTDPRVDKFYGGRVWGARRR